MSSLVLLRVSPTILATRSPPPGSDSLPRRCESKARFPFRSRPHPDPWTRALGNPGYPAIPLSYVLRGPKPPTGAAHPPTRYNLGMVRGSSAATPASHDEAARAVDALVDACRGRALWFFRPDYYPRTDDERRSILDAIQKHGDVATFQRAARLQEWLSRHSSAASASS